MRWVVLTGATAFLGCLPSVDLPDLFRVADFQDPPGVRLNYIRSAPVVAVGTVTAAKPIGKERRASQDNRIMIQLTRISLRVENVLRGRVDEGDVDFYYYTFAAHNKMDLGVAHYLPVKGERRVFFLKPFNSSYRSVGDVTDYTIPVLSGQHNSDICRSDSFGECLAKILLTPGTGYNYESFAATLRKSAYIAEMASSKGFAYQLLQDLARNQNETISIRAASILDGRM